MQIGRKDVAWNFAATSMRIAYGVFVLPFSLRLLTSQDIGLWNIFLTIGAFSTILDFGFSNAFSRNITYVFSGVKELKKEGYVPVNTEDTSIDYGLLKTLIATMKRYYAILALGFLVLFLLIGTLYIHSILKKYTGNTTTVLIAWVLYGILVAYQLYTYYYASLLTGRGYILRSNQIIIIGQCIQIVIIIVCLFLGFGILSMVVGLLLSNIITRILSYQAFYDKIIKQEFRTAIIKPVKEIMRVLTPNALKIGFVSLGAFIIVRSSMMIAPLYLSLSDIASFGTTQTVINLISSLSGVWFATYYPKLTQYRVTSDTWGVKRLYIKGNLFLIAGFGILGTLFVIAGPFALHLIKSQTHFLPAFMIIALLTFTCLGNIQGNSTNLITTKNEVPFFKSYLITGGITLIFLLLGLQYTSLGIWTMILSPGIAQLMYTNWKWPYMVIKEQTIRWKDIKTIVLSLQK